MSFILLAGIIIALSACGREGADVVTGYGVAHSDGSLLIVAPLDPDNLEGYRDAVWIDNLGKKHVGGLLRVTLGDTADSYPSLSSSRNTQNLKQLKGEKEILRLCLGYAQAEWQDQYVVVNAVNYSEERMEWEVVIGSLFDDRSITLQVDRNKEIVEAE